MNKFLAAALLTCFSMTLNAQDHLCNFQIQKNPEKAPYSFVWIEKGKLAARETEISVDDYLAFLEEVTNDSTIAYIQGLIPSPECVLYPYLESDKIGQVPDDARKINWINEEKFKADFNWPPKEKIKGVHKSYYNPYDKPITGITYEQALEFANWCTRKFNKARLGAEATVPTAVIFRLPTPGEFTSMHEKGIACKPGATGDALIKCKKTKRQLESCMNDKGCALCNVTGIDTCEANKMWKKIYKNEPLYTAWAFNPNWLGMYCVMGNAAEMTSIKGVAKGGSYMQSAAECQPASVQSYSKPEKWLGMRLVAEIITVDGEKVRFDNEGELIITR